MIDYVLRRLIALIPVWLGISLLVYSTLVLLPGDPATAILGPYASEARVAELQRQLGLDRPLFIQYWDWLTNVVRGDLGHSYAFERPVSQLVAERLGPTLLLASAALTLGTLLGLMLGSLAAVHRGWLDRALTAFSLIGISTPAFWLAMLGMLGLSVHLGWFPVSGMQPHLGESSALAVAHHLVLPASTLALTAAGVIARLMRAAMLEALSSDYVRMARAKGLDESRVRYSHAFRSSIAQVIPVIGLQAGFVLGGTVYVETVFQWPGLGKLLVDAIAERDLLLVQGGVLVVASLYVLVNLATDILQRLLDPRVRV